MKSGSQLKSSGRDRRWVPYLVLLVSTLLTAVVTIYVEQSSTSKDRLRFMNAVEQTQASIQSRLETYVAMLRAGAALFAADSTVSAQQFKLFVDRLELPDRYPGVLGVGFAVRVRPGQTDSLVGAIRRQGLLQYGIFPADVSGERYPVLYLEPLNQRNRAVIGYDMFSDSTRRQAMERARDSGRASASRKVLLKQETDVARQRGFLIYLPVYRGGGIPGTIQERRRQLVGFVYSPFRSGDLLQGILQGQSAPRVDFAVYDGPDPSPRQLLHSSTGSPIDSDAGAMVATTHLRMAGQSWTIVYIPRPEFDQVSASAFVPYIFVAGLVVSLLFFWMIRSEEFARVAAEQTAADLEASQEALRRSQAGLRRLVDANIVGVVLADGDGGIVEANDAFLAMVGFSREDLTAGRLDWRRLTPEEYAEIDREAIDEVRSSGSHAPHEQEFFRKDGRRVPVLIGRAALDESGQRTIGFIVDVGERKKIEQALRESEIRFRTMIEQSPIAVQLFALDGTCIHVNASWETLWRTGQEQLAGYNIRHDPLLHARGLAPMIERAFAGEKVIIPLVHYDPAEIGRAGRERWIKLNFYPLRDVEERITEIALKIEDVTDRVEVERELHVAKEAAEAASRAKDQFLAVLSHELRTPLTPVLTAIQVLQEDPDEARQMGMIEIIRRNVELEARLIDDLLDLTRITNGKLRLSLETVDVHALVRNTIEMSRAEIERKRIDVRLDLEAADRFVRGDSARLHQVLWNLINNAVKFTPENGWIGIDSHNHDGRLTVSVADSGIGIEADVLPRIFNAFEQGEKTITRRFGGLGLGLAISKMIVDLHGGSLTVASDGRDKGSTFTVMLTTLPGLQAEASARPAQLSGGEDGAGRKILLVDDHEDTSQVMKILLEQRGYRVLLADSVRSAIAVAARERFDLLISDIGLPDGTGLELMKTLSSLYPVPGIALSGFGMEEDVRKSIDAGFRRHLIKPVDFQLLQEAVQQLVG